MSEKYRFHKDGLFFVTMTVVGWIDVFTRKKYADEIIKNLNYCIEHKGLEVYEFCIMSNHLHLICSAKDGEVGKVIRDFKSFTAKEIIRLIDENPQESRKEWLLYMFRYFAKGSSPKCEFQFWQHHNHPIWLESRRFILQRTRYIWNNPVKAGIVSEPQHYIYSSANPDTELKLS
ncbi:REP-associated tyrosine transposase [Dyadobacter pollutisoli]|jgi:REP element-mobilizing transposase RayT|uniref:Transposase n=1 Tax=Dyadobacter pollutisoli TaxID=2910158 RepID=A0A9E8NHG1_9BACT|nr:transposase [Dyadobacter pollutisoli]WAC15051.1 transposase [Dyadobacter pollutisoli]